MNGNHEAVLILILEPCPSHRPTDHSNLKRPAGSLPAVALCGANTCIKLPPANGLLETFCLVGHRAAEYGSNAPSCGHDSRTVQFGVIRAMHGEKRSGFGGSLESEVAWCGDLILARVGASLFSGRWSAA